MEDLLFLTHRIPYPPNKGDKIRSYHLLKHLTHRYRVHLGTFIDDPDDWQHVDHVKGFCGRTHFARLNPNTARLRSLGGLITNQPLTLDYYRDASLQAWVKRVLHELPVRRILVFSSAVAQYVSQAGHVRRIIDFVDIDSDKWLQYARKKTWPMSWLYRREGRLLLHYERQVARDFDASLFVSQAEADLFKQLAPESAAKTGFFNNGVDTDYFSPARSYQNPYPADALPLVFTGAMDYWPNVDAVQWFAREILPSVLTQNPGARFYIVGSRPTAAVRALAELPGVTVTGIVSDIRPYLAHARLAVAPLRIARGIQNKVLEAMAMAKPVIASAQALEGISANIGEEVLLALDSSEFIATISALLQRPLDAIGKAARVRVLADYTWERTLAEVDVLLAPDAPMRNISTPLKQAIPRSFHATEETP
jgi:sugar transferase (PEP-CTERM/EpsH1 system associated)